jgi:hypothetical protein
MLGNAVCLVPSVLTALSRRPNRWFLVLIVLDLCAIGAQTSTYWFWPVGFTFEYSIKTQFLGRSCRDPPKSDPNLYLCPFHFWRLVAELRITDVFPSACSRIGRLQCKAVGKALQNLCDCVAL